MRVWSLLVGAMALPVVLSAQDPAPGPILERASARYRALSALEADFTQVVDHPMLGRLESRGHLYQTGQSKLAMRFRDPPNEAIVADGKHLWVYTPSATPNQVLRYDLPSGRTYGVNVLSWILDRPAERYHARYHGRGTVTGRDVDIIDLIPKDAGLPFSAATVWLDHETGLPRQVSLAERGNNQRTITLDNIVTNVALPKDVFVFRVPRGARVVEPS